MAKKKPLAKWLFNFLNGAPHSKLVEPMVEIEEFPIIWKRPPLDLEKLAYFHKVQGWNLDKLANWANRSPITIRQILKRIADENGGKNE